MKARLASEIGRRTIDDFGNQWLRYDGSSGFFGSREALDGIVFPFDLRRVKGCRVVDLGAGAGRHIKVLLDAGAGQVIALEPSRAIDLIRDTVEDLQRVILLNTSGDNLPAYGDVDFIFSIGVLHHVPDPDPVVASAYRCLRPGGQFIVWLYGRENNRLYLALAEPLRLVTRKLPHWALVGLVWVIYAFLKPYVRLCFKFDLPFSHYVRSFFSKMSPEKQRLIIYDQLNPAYAKYYTRQEAHDLLAAAGFKVTLNHRLNFSWTVIGTK